MPEWQVTKGTLDRPNTPGWGFCSGEGGPPFRPHGCVRTANPGQVGVGRGEVADGIGAGCAIGDGVGKGE